MYCWHSLLQLQVPTPICLKWMWSGERGFSTMFARSSRADDLIRSTVETRSSLYACPFPHSRELDVDSSPNMPLRRRMCVAFQKTGRFLQRLFSISPRHSIETARVVLVHLIECTRILCIICTYVLMRKQFGTSPCSAANQVPQYLQNKKNCIRKRLSAVNEVHCAYV